MDQVEVCGIRTRVPVMLGLLNTMRRIAPVDAPVLIEGETGVGKELVARALHALGDRSGKPFLTTDCGALPEALAESELFGHERGAFTGADRSYSGRIECAAGGTLFLDEVNSLPLAIQTKLLRFLERQELFRIGRASPISIETRVISASNTSLENLVAAGRMRSDFFYRINVLRLEIPALRERRDDIPLLVGQFLERDPLARQFGATRVADAAMADLMARPWPGNVRELMNLLRRSLVHGCRGGVLRLLEGYRAISPMSRGPAVDPGCPLPAFRAWMRERERDYLVALLERHPSTSGQARASGLPQRTLYRKVRNLRCFRDVPPQDAIDWPLAAISGARP
jgi:transcriptional regulator with PAS, ATPase and Fis domain